MRKHANFIKHVLPLHVLTGCDTASSIFGIGKIKAVNIHQKVVVPPPLGDAQIDMASLDSRATTFITACYGSKCNGTMPDIRFGMWKHNTGQSKSKSFKLASLPPTSESFELHVRHAHYQSCIWRNAMEADPPGILATDFGWKVDHSTKSLLPVAMPDNTLPAPASLMSILCCRCSGPEACYSQMCYCHKSGMTCSIFCNSSIKEVVTCTDPINNLLTTADDSEDENDQDNKNDV